MDRITHYMYVPVALAPTLPAPAPTPMPLMLTKQEQKKIKHKKKMEKQREEHDLIKFGLKPAPEPRGTAHLLTALCLVLSARANVLIQRLCVGVVVCVAVKLSNIMRVLGNDAVSDPSAMEAKVRRQMAERKSKHEEANASRQLTAEQRWEKKLAKLKDEKKAELQCAVYLVGDLSDEKRRLKIDRMAQQLLLTGVGLIYIEANVLVVEGGMRALKKFTRLLTHRIQWKSAPASAAASGAVKAEGEADGAGDGTAMVEDKAGGGEDDDDEDDSTETKAAPKAFVVWQVGLSALWCAPLPVDTV